MGAIPAQQLGAQEGGAGLGRGKKEACVLSCETWSLKKSYKNNLRAGESGISFLEDNFQGILAWEYKTILN